jgi:hypothetical protein
MQASHPAAGASSCHNSVAAEGTPAPLLASFLAAKLRTVELLTAAEPQSPSVHGTLEQSPTYNTPSVERQQRPGWATNAHSPPLAGMPPSARLVDSHLNPQDCRGRGPPRASIRDGRVPSSSEASVCSQQMRDYVVNETTAALGQSCKDATAKVHRAKADHYMGIGSYAEMGAAAVACLEARQVYERAKYGIVKTRITKGAVSALLR